MCIRDRADTEAVCRACGETWVTDETNEADDYARNRLRHGALPALCAANRAAERNQIISECRGTFSGMKRENAWHLV